MSAAAGLGALGFWLFIAVVVGSGIWYDARRKEMRQETLRRIVESGRDIDPAVIDRLIGTSTAKDLGRDLKIGALIVLAAAPGLFVLSLFLGVINPDARSAVMGVSMLVAFVGAGLLMASRLVERRYADH
jgi:hypothetical protein